MVTLKIREGKIRSVRSTKDALPIFATFYFPKTISKCEIYHLPNGGHTDLVIIFYKDEIFYNRIYILYKLITNVSMTKAEILHQGNWIRIMKIIKS